MVINEFSYDDTGTDDQEYVELYNSTSKSINIGGWVLESYDQVGPNTFYTIPANTILKAGAYYVMGSAKVPKVNQVVGTTNIWENSQESLTLTDSSKAIVDTVVYEANKISPTATWHKKLIEGGGIWGNFTSAAGYEMAWSRFEDGLDTGNNRDFHLMPWTPGKSNNFSGVPLLIDNFDSGKVDAPHAAFAGSFRAAYYIDPTKLGMQNQNVIKASPQGGNALIFWDTTGGGNTCIFKKKAIRDVVIEAYVYFDAKLEASSSEWETWSIGVQGSTGTYANHPDPSRKLGFTAAGNTGVCAIFQVTSTFAKVWLVDYDDGGTDFKVLGEIPVTHTKNDGWQRLRLEVSGDYASLIYGGTFGKPDGTIVGGRIRDSRRGGIYFAYRENVFTNAGARPLTVDLLQIRPANTFAEDYGKATATTRGTPHLGVANLPLIGNKSFALVGSGLVPSGAVLAILGASKTSIALSPIGFPKGSTLYTAPIVTGSAATNASGVARLPAPLPADASLLGANLYWQIFDPDPKLSTTYPLGTSNGLQTRLGN